MDKTNYLVVNERNSVVFCNNPELSALGPYVSITQALLDEDGIGEAREMKIGDQVFVFTTQVPYYFLACTNDPKSIRLLPLQINALKQIILGIIGPSIDVHSLPLAEFDRVKTTIGRLMNSYSRLLLTDQAFLIQGIEHVKLTNPNKLFSQLPEAFPSYTHAFVLIGTKIAEEFHQKGFEAIPDEDLLLLLAHADSCLQYEKKEEEEEEDVLEEVEEEDEEEKKKERNRSAEKDINKKFDGEKKKERKQTQKVQIEKDEEEDLEREKNEEGEEDSEALVKSIEKQEIILEDEDGTEEENGNEEKKKEVKGNEEVLKEISLEASSKSHPSQINLISSYTPNPSSHLSYNHPPSPFSLLSSTSSPSPSSSNPFTSPLLALLPSSSSPSSPLPFLSLSFWRYKFYLHDEVRDKKLIIIQRRVETYHLGQGVMILVISRLKGKVLKTQGTEKSNKEKKTTTNTSSIINTNGTVKDAGDEKGNDGKVSLKQAFSASLLSASSPLSSTSSGIPIQSSFLDGTPLPNISAFPTTSHSPHVSAFSSSSPLSGNNNILLPSFMYYGRQKNIEIRQGVADLFASSYFTPPPPSYSSPSAPLLSISYDDLPDEENESKTTDERAKESRKTFLSSMAFPSHYYFRQNLVEKYRSHNMWFYRSHQKYRGLIHFIFVERGGGGGSSGSSNTISNRVVAPRITTPVKETLKNEMMNSVGKGISGNQSYQESSVSSSFGTSLNGVYFSPSTSLYGNNYPSSQSAPPVPPPPQVQASAPTPEVPETDTDEFIESLIHNALWECVCFGQQALANGCHCAVAKSDPFIMCYSVYTLEKRKDRVSFQHPRQALDKALSYYATELKSTASQQNSTQTGRGKAKGAGSSGVKGGQKMGDQKGSPMSPGGFPSSRFALDPHFYRLFKRSLCETNQTGSLCEVYGLYSNTLSCAQVVYLNMVVMARLKA